MSADFLAQMFSSGGGSSPGLFDSVISQAGSKLSDAIFGRSDRISNRDYQFYQDLADSGNPREANRQNQFLDMTTPNAAKNYNVYQDATYQQDVDRKTKGISSMAEGLGMSPWELTGSGGAAPIPSGDFGQQSSNNQAGQFMAQMMPLKVAELNARTSLANTKMQTDAQKQIAGQATNDGALGKALTDKAAAEVILTGASTTESAARTNNIRQDTKQKEATTALTWSQTAATENKIVLDSIATLAGLLPKVTANVGPYKNESIQGYKELGQLAALLMDRGAGNQTELVRQFISDLPADKWAGMERDLKRVSRLAVDAGFDAAGNLIGSMWKKGEEFGGFLQDLFK